MVGGGGVTPDRQTIETETEFSLSLSHTHTHTHARARARARAHTTHMTRLVGLMLKTLLSQRHSKLTVPVALSRSFYVAREEKHGQL